MNRRVILFHLREAAEELNRTVEELTADPRYSEESLEVAMGHAYHHLNNAWNGRHQTNKEFRDCTERDFNRLRKFPKEAEFVYLQPRPESEPAYVPNRRPARSPHRKARGG